MTHAERPCDQAQRHHPPRLLHELDKPMTITVKAGQLPPNPANTDWNCGTT
jgi:hypothetical protein